MVMLFVCIGVQTCGLAASPRSGRPRGQQQDRTSFQSWSVCTCEDDHVVMERRVCHRQNWIPMTSFFIIKSLGYLYGIQQWSVLKTPVCLYGVQCTGVGGFVIGEPRANREDESEGTLSELLVSGHDNAATSSCLGSILFNIVFTSGDDKIHWFWHWARIRQLQVTSFWPTKYALTWEDIKINQCIISLVHQLIKIGPSDSSVVFPSTINAFKIQTYFPVGGTSLWFDNNHDLIRWGWSQVEPAVVYFLVLVTGVPLRCGNVAYRGVFRMLLCLSLGIGSLLIGISGRVGTLNMLLCLYCDDVTH